MASVTFEHVYKRWGDVTAVNDLNIHVEDKEFLVFVGPSGCGKTTSLRLLAGLEEISDGNIKIGDRIVNDVPPKDRDIAMVFQSYALYPNMTVAQNIGFALEMRGVGKAERDKAIADVAKQLLKRPEIPQPFPGFAILGNGGFESFGLQGCHRPAALF